MIEEHGPVALQPRLKPHQRLRCRSPVPAREVPLPAIRRELPHREHRLEPNPGHRLQHGLPQPATLTVRPLDIDQTQIHRHPRLRVPAENDRDRYSENRTREVRSNPTYGANVIAQCATQ